MGGTLLRILTKGGKGMSIKIDVFVLPNGLRLNMMTYENGHKCYAITDERIADSLVGIKISIGEQEFNALRPIAREVKE